MVGASGGLFAFIGAYGRLSIAGRTPAARRQELTRFLVLMGAMILLFSLPGSPPAGEPWPGRRTLGGLLAGAALAPQAVRLSYRGASASSAAPASRGPGNGHA